MSEKKTKAETKPKVEKTKKAKKTAKTTEFSSRKTLIMMGLAFVALVIVVMAIVVVNRKRAIDSSYFHDAENKIVVTMDKESASIEGSAFEPYITHMVYYHDGSVVTGLEAFYEYESEAVAKAVYDYLKPNGFADAKYRNGRFIVFRVNQSKYEGLTVEELKSEIEKLKEIDAVITDYDENTLSKYGKWYMPEFEEESEEVEVREAEEGAPAASDN